MPFVPGLAATTPALLLEGFFPADLWPATLVLVGLALGLLIGVLALRTGGGGGSRRGRPAQPARDAALADLVEISADWLWETDAGGRFTRFTAGRDNVPLASPLAYLDHTMTDIEFHTDDPATLERYFRAVAAREPFRNFVHHIEVEGRRQYRRVSGRPLFSPEGTFLGYRGITVDATAEGRAAAEARATRQRLTDAIESISEGFALFDANDRLILYNSRARSVLGLGPEPRAGLGRTFANLIGEAAESGHLLAGDGNRPQWLADRLERHRRAEGASLNQLGDGRWLRVSEHRTRDGGIVIIYTDVSADQRREAEIRRQGELLQTTFDNMIDGILVADQDLRVVAWNQRFIALTKVPPDILLRPEFSFLDLIRWQSQRGDYGARPAEQVIAAAQAMIKNKVPVDYERVRSDGSVLRRRLQPLPGGGIVSIYNDVTIQRQADASLRSAKEQAEAASRAKSEFLANMSHELRTPLNAIIGFSEILRDQILGPIDAEHYVEYARDINESGRHLLNIINDILDISKAEAGRLVLHEERVDAAEMVESCLRLMRDQAERGQLTLTATLPTGLHLIVDSRKIKQVVLNLLSNAIKFTPAGGRIEVKAGLTEGNAARIGIHDSGIGMAEADIPRMFEAFAQVDSALNRRHEGTGLGLPLCKMLAEIHGGTLAIESAPGRGTVATLTLPPERVAGASSQPHSEPQRQKAMFPSKIRP